jgi:hypothetical protein
MLRHISHAVARGRDQKNLIKCGGIQTQCMCEEGSHMHLRRGQTHISLGEQIPLQLQDRSVWECIRWKPRRKPWINSGAMLRYQSEQNSSSSLLLSHVLQAGLFLSFCEAICNFQLRVWYSSKAQAVLVHSLTHKAKTIITFFSQHDCTIQSTYYLLPSIPN